MSRAIALAAAFSTTLGVAQVHAEEPPSPRWYISHFGPETCVPLDDIDIASGQRLYYGAGSLRSPEDFVRAMDQLHHEDPIHNHPIVLKEALPHMITYETPLYYAPYLRSIYVLFNDKDLCTRTMRALQP